MQLGFRTLFHTEIFCMSLGLVEIKIECVIACWTSLNVYFHGPKSQKFVLCGFGVIGPEVEAIHKSPIPSNKLEDFSSRASGYQHR